MTKPERRRAGQRWLIVAAGLAAAGAVLLVAQSMGPGSPLPDAGDAPDARPAAVSALTKTTVEAAKKTPAATAAAVPLHPPPLVVRSAPEVGEASPAPPSGLALPDGYAPTPEPEPMHRARLAPASVAPLVSDAATPDWLHGPDAIDGLLAGAAAAGRDWTFGWLQLADGASPRALGQHDVQVLGTAGRLVRARLPADAQKLAAIGALPTVAGLGTMPPDRKIADELRRAAEAQPAAPQPAFVTLMADDPDGEWAVALQAMGVSVGRFDRSLRTYTAHIDAAALDALAAADFVLSVAPVAGVRAAHDTAVAAMGADAVRQHGATAGSFVGSGGASVPIGVLDTGLNTRHMDISSARGSICGANFVETDHRAEDDDLWHDEGGHGSHVTGTFVGSGHYRPRFAGMAPLVRHIRFGKVLGRGGYGSLDGVLRGMDFLAQSSRCRTTRGRTAAAKPLIVNMSLSGSRLIWDGRNMGARKLDAVVWNAQQLYVVAQSNENIHGFSDLAAAKNSLAAGATRDDGTVAFFSSLGPTADGRLAPSLVGVGYNVYSVAGGGAYTGYRAASGTSMASPAVAGVAALLMDVARGYRNRPALARARLMASAIKVDAWLAAPGAFPADNSGGPGTQQARYGLGKASARTSALTRNQADGWTNGGSAATMSEGDYGYRDISVPRGASRLDVVLTWDEPPAEAIGSSVLNDLDLWLDRGAECELAACGEYVSRSRKDNVEWLVIQDPPPGRYRIKAVAHRIYTAPPRAGIAWTVVRGASTPTLRVEADRSELAHREEVTVTVSADAYVAAGVRLQVACRDADGANCGYGGEPVALVAEDGEWRARFDKGQSLALGEVAVGERAQLRFRAFSGNSPRRLYFTATGWNALAGSASLVVRADDGTAPAAAERPANDDFLAAATLDGAAGEQALDLLLATPEPGEPVYTPVHGRPSGSVWFRWQAPADGPVHTSLTASDMADELRVDVFQGEHVAGLSHLGGAAFGVSYFATAGSTYFVRVSFGRDGPVATVLRWSQGTRPANDDFAAAQTLAGATGDVEGHNLGATLEPGEQLAQLGGTVWYRWRAVADGGLEFFTNSLATRVLVFTGEGIGALRLVSGPPAQSTYVPVRAGEEYLIAVAAADAYTSGRHFTLSWTAVERFPSNDDFGEAEPLMGERGSEPVVTGESVEPGEPAASGVQTRWWAWTAPRAGRFTFRLVEASGAAVQLVAFSATAESPTFADLRLVGTTGQTSATTAVTVPAVANRRYYLAVGWPAGDAGAFGSFEGQATLEWAPQPANDALARAATLQGAEGTAMADARFATVEPAERTDVLGHFSLWWRYQPPTAGWWRFRVADATVTLTVYRQRGSGLEQVATSVLDWREAEEAEVLFWAEPGDVHMIRLGWRSDQPGEVELAWEQGEAPAWLRYAGRLSGSALGLGEEDTGLSLAFDDVGTTAYLSSSQGLHVLSRDPASGMVAAAGRVEAAADSLLAWDAARERLWAKAPCGDWQRFAPVGGSRAQLRSEGVFDVQPTPTATDCAEALLLDAAAETVTLRRPFGVDVLALPAGRARAPLRSVATLDLFNNAAALAADGTRLYLLDDGALIALARDPATGTLSRAGEAFTDGQAGALALGAGDTLAFVVAADGSTAAFRLLPDEDDPQWVARQAPFGNAPFGATVEPCEIAFGRAAQPAVAAFCTNSAFTAQLRGSAEDEALEAADYLAPWQPDRFDNSIPVFEPRAAAASPDGRHLYLVADTEGAFDASAPDDVLVFERVGNNPSAGAAEARAER